MPSKSKMNNNIELTNHVEKDNLGQRSNIRNYPKNENRRMLKNVILISGAFMLLFTAFQSMANLQSSINSDGGLGVYSLSIIYGSLVISSVFIPTILIRWLTAKWTLCLSMIAYSLYIGAQFYPTFYTLIPASIFLGISAAPLWISKCFYLTQVGNHYAELIGDQTEVVLVRFFGIFFCFFQSSQVWGNLISSTVLSAGLENSKPISEAGLAICGRNFCPKSIATIIESNSSIYGNLTEENSNLSRPSSAKIYTIASIYLGCSILAIIIIACLVDPLTRYGEKERQEESSKLTGFALLGATLNQMKNPLQIVIIPLTIWSGLEQGFFSADFTQAYISCAWGVERIGFVMICYGVCDAIGSVSFGPLIKKIGRIPIFIFGAAINIAVLITLLKWMPNPDKSYVFFIIAGLWGVADSIWQTQINALYGVMFPSCEEAAFSNYRLWESIGFILAYVLSNNTCTLEKLYILLGVIGIGMIGYFIGEFLTRKNAKKSADI